MLKQFLTVAVIASATILPQAVQAQVKQNAEKVIEQNGVDSLWWLKGVDTIKDMPKDKAVAILKQNYNQLHYEGDDPFDISMQVSDSMRNHDLMRKVLPTRKINQNTSETVNKLFTDLSNYDKSMNANLEEMFDALITKHTTTLASMTLAKQIIANNGKVVVFTKEEKDKFIRAHQLAAAMYADNDIVHYVRNMGIEQGKNEMVNSHRAHFCWYLKQRGILPNTAKECSVANPYKFNDYIKAGAKDSIYRSIDPNNKLKTLNGESTPATPNQTVKRSHKM